MPTIYDEIEELETEATTETTEEEVEQEEIEDQQDDADTHEDDAEDEESTQEEEAEEPEKEEKLDAAAFARMRRELREAKQKAAELERAQQPQQKQEAEPVQETAEERLARLEGHIAKNELTQRAIQEFSSMEREYMAENPHYDAAGALVQKEMIRAEMLLNPSMTPERAAQNVMNKILRIASNSVNQGANPCEVLYDMAVERFGFRPEVKQEVREKKTDLAKIDKNKKRSATPLSAGGSSGKAAVTLESVGNMSLADFNKLTPEQMRELEAQSY